MSNSSYEQEAISQLQVELQKAVSDKKNRALVEKYQATERKVVVSPEDYDPRSKRLQLVDAVGPLDRIDGLRQQLADKASELGGDLVCEVRVVPLPRGEGPHGWGYDRILITGLAVKSSELQETERVKRLEIESLDLKIDDLRDSIERYAQRIAA